MFEPMRAELREQFHNESKWQYQALDQGLAVLCILAPAVMIVAEWIQRTDVSAPRDSISAYHDMLPGGAFFIPLTIAVMLFVMNGWLIPGHRAHVVMGLYLLGVILFDHDDKTTLIHFAFAGYFYGTGALLEVVRHRSEDEEWGPRGWIGRAFILPFWILFTHFREAWNYRRRVLWVLLPFVFGAALANLGVEVFESHWLLMAEWVAMAAVVVQYVIDARSHALHTSELMTAE